MEKKNESTLLEEAEEIKKGIFETLFALDVNSKVEDKNGLKYLSWSWAWAEVKKRYPSAYYSIERFGEEKLPYIFDEDLGYMVFTRVNIEGEEYEMWLPVMDSSNKAMLNHEYTYEVNRKKWDNNTRRYIYEKETKTVAKASMFDINKTIMRCLVKNLSMFGLGLYIYSGEDLPEDLLKEDDKLTEKLATPNQIAMLKKTYTGDNLEKLLKTNKLKKIEDISFEKADEIINKLKKKMEG